MLLWAALFTPAIGHAAALIVNEFSNGRSGSKEFFELMVVGNAGSPTGNVNLNGWIIDDNNGDWQGSSTGIGISGGYLSINTVLNPGSCGALNAVAPGSILVIYNPDDINANVPADDFSDINVVKSSTVDSDPINTSLNPKAIPGSEIIYSIFVENTGFGEPDGSTVVIIDVLAPQTSLFVGNFAGRAPVGFNDGGISSTLGLTYGGFLDFFDSIDFSMDGGTNYNYVPVPDGDGFDSNVTHLRIVPVGTFAASDGTNDPSFTLEFKVRQD